MPMSGTEMEKDTYLPTCLLYLVPTTHPPLDSKHYVREVSQIAINIDMEKDTYLPACLTWCQQHILHLSASTMYVK